MTEYVLETAAAELAGAAAHSPTAYELTPAEARTSLEQIQSGSAAKPDGDTAWMTVEVDGVEARVSIAKPVGALGLCNAGKKPVGDFGSREPTRATAC